MIKGNNLPCVDLYGRTSVLCDCCGQDCVQDNMQFICKYYLLLFWLYFDWCLIFLLLSFSSHSLGLTKTYNIHFHTCAHA